MEKIWLYNGHVLRMNHGKSNVNPGKSDSTTMQQKKHLDCTSWHVVRSKFGGLQLFLLLSGSTPAAKACVSLAKSPTAHQLHRAPSHPSPSVKETLLFGGFALNCGKSPRFVVF